MIFSDRLHIRRGGKTTAKFSKGCYGAGLSYIGITLQKMQNQGSKATQ